MFAVGHIHTNKGPIRFKSGHQEPHFELSIRHNLDIIVLHTVEPVPKVYSKWSFTGDSREELEHPHILIKHTQSPSPKNLLLQGWTVDIMCLVKPCCEETMFRTMIPNSVIKVSPSTPPVQLPMFSNNRFNFHWVPLSLRSLPVLCSSWWTSTLHEPRFMVAWITGSWRSGYSKCT